MEEFYACIREKRRPSADMYVGATAALTTIMGREAIYRQRSVTWDDLGVSAMPPRTSPYPSPGFVSLMPQERFLRTLDTGGRTSASGEWPAARSSARESRTGFCAARSLTATTFSVRSGASRRKAG